MSEQKITTALQQKGLIKLMGLDFSIQYKKGKENLVADALSRHIEFNGNEVECQVIVATASPRWLEDIIQTYEDDEWAK